jgi:hypothetical protein
MAAFLALCGLALTVDRVFLLPQAAEARAPTGVEATPVSAVAPEDDAACESAIRDELAKGLRALAAERGIRPEEVADAFEPPSDWIVLEPDDPDSPKERFRSEHLLGGTFVGERSHAIVDRERLSLGESIDGFTLVSVGPRSALFERDGVEVELTLDEREESD